MGGGKSLSNWPGTDPGTARGRLGDNAIAGQEEKRCSRRVSSEVSWADTSLAGSLGLARVAARPGEADRRSPVPAAVAGGSRAAGAAPGCAPARLQRAFLALRPGVTRRLRRSRVRRLRRRDQPAAALPPSIRRDGRWASARRRRPLS